MTLPVWLWGGAIAEMLKAARLAASPSSGVNNTVDVEVGAIERSASGRPDLVTVTEIAGDGDSRFELLVRAEQAARDIPFQVPAGAEKYFEELQKRVAPAGQAGLIAPAFGLLLGQTQLAAPAVVAEVCKVAYEEFKRFPVAETGEPAFPDTSVHFVHRDRSLMHRSKFSSILLRMEHDQRLRDADLTQVASAIEGGDLIFASSSALGSGMVLLDCYLAPLFGAMSPFVWAFPVTRASGTIIFSLGCPISGTLGEAAEPLQLLPSQGPEATIEAPKLSRRSGAATVKWWVRRLDKFLSVVTDPAVYSDVDGRYVASKNLHAILSVEQVFRRVTSIQHAHRNADARRVLLFTVLDTLERLTNRRLTEMCNLNFARRTLEDLRAGMSADVASVLLPAAERAINSLETMQKGFFLQRQMGSDKVEFTDRDGVLQALEPIRAVAEYIRVLRNATHGHGSNREDRKLSTDALLAHHDGVIPNDLALLAYLYLLELLTKPDMLRRNLYNGGLV